MKSKTQLCLWMGMGAGLLSACGGDQSSGSTAPTPPSPQSLDTQAVLTLALEKSETAAPFPVNGGLVTFTDTSETTAPIAVNGM